MRFNILTTGPMKIPGQISGDPAGGPPDVVRASISNPTNRDYRIQLFAEVCSLDEDGVGESTLFPDAVFVIPAGSCRNRTFGFLDPDIGGNAGDQLRFFAVGDVELQAVKLELSFVGQRLADEMNEPTMFFRHDDLLEVRNRYTHPISEAVRGGSSQSWDTLTAGDEGSNPASAGNEAE
ncbi:hypothetical protein [Bacillus infantis]|uniref:hypothetical protein n=1 Tax=Bacillus infantis TaxID=324767 RepID=UPI003CFB063C